MVHVPIEELFLPIPERKDNEVVEALLAGAADDLQDPVDDQTKRQSKEKSVDRESEDLTGNDYEMVANEDHYVYVMKDGHGDGEKVERESAAKDSEVITMESESVARDSKNTDNEEPVGEGFDLVQDAAIAKQNQAAGTIADTVAKAHEVVAMESESASTEHEQSEMGFESVTEDSVRNSGSEFDALKQQEADDFESVFDSLVPMSDLHELWSKNVQNNEKVESVLYMDGNEEFTKQVLQRNLDQYRLEYCNNADENGKNYFFFFDRAYIETHLD